MDGAVGTPAARAGSGERREGTWVVLWRRNHAGLGLGVGAALAGPAALRLARGRLMRGLYSPGAATGQPASMPRYDDRRQLACAGNR
jgi:hypothetical protein